MGTVRRRRRDSRRELSAYRAYQLLSGPQNYCGYKDGDEQQMRADWHSNRAELIRVWNGADPYDFFAWRPWLSVDRDHELPWAERMFGEPIARRRRSVG